ncbi:MAG: hypothetical protein ABIR70_12885 [Bryobacteraceae bacterium]
MPRTRTAASPTVETKPPSKTRGSAAVPTERKRTPVRRKPATPAAAVMEFDVAEHYDEIAASAYLNFLARDGSPGSSEDDWILAETTVRSKYGA